MCGACLCGTGCISTGGIPEGRQKPPSVRISGRRHAASPHQAGEDMVDQSKKLYPEHAGWTSDGFLRAAQLARGGQVDQAELVARGTGVCPLARIVAISPHCVVRLDKSERGYLGISARSVGYTVGT